jgi:hypothetical protein
MCWIGPEFLPEFECKRVCYLRPQARPGSTIITRKIPGSYEPLNITANVETEGANEIFLVWEVFREFSIAQLGLS